MILDISVEAVFLLRKMFLTVLFILAILGLFLWRDTRKPNLYPPGPRWLPIIGVLLTLGQLHKIHRFYHLMWHHLYCVYGAVVGLRVGNSHVVIVSGRKAIKEVYSIEAFNGRPNGFFYRVRTFNQRLGLVFSDGDFWDSQRKFSVKILRQIGLGRSSMIEHIEREATDMVAHFRKISGGGDAIIEMQHAFDIPVLNILWALVAGYRFEFDDERLQKLLHMIHECFRVIDMSGGLLNLIPWIRHLAPNLCGYRPLVNAHKPLWKFIEEVVAEKRENFAAADKCKSFIDSYLLELRRKADGHEIHSSFSDEQLLGMCLDFFQAGTETTSNTLSFGLMYMIHNKRVCDKVRSELDAVVGRKRMPNINDRNHLPYVEAVLFEIQRYANVAPLGIAHRAEEAVKFFDYIIPKDAVVLVSLYSLNMDEEYWKDPKEFRPERFLNDNGDLIQHAEQFFPFGMGKRRCIGENLAKSSLFLYFASFMHAFDMIIPPGCDLPNIMPNDGITLQPKPFLLKLKSRF